MLLLLPFYTKETEAQRDYLTPNPRTVKCQQWRLNPGSLALDSVPLTYPALSFLNTNLQRSLLRTCKQLFNMGRKVRLLLPMWFIWLYSKIFPHANRTPCKYYTKFSCTEGICDGYLDWHIKYPKQNTPRLEDFLFHELETWKDCRGIRSVISSHL